MKLYSSILLRYWDSCAESLADMMLKRLLNPSDSALIDGSRPHTYVVCSWHFTLLGSTLPVPIIVSEITWFLFLFNPILVHLASHLRVWLWLLTIDFQAYQ